MIVCYNRIKEEMQETYMKEHNTTIPGGGVDDGGNLLVSSVRFIIILSVLYFLVTFLMDRFANYEGKRFPSTKFEDTEKDHSYIDVAYRVWERKKFAYLKEHYREGNQLTFDGKKYEVLELRTHAPAYRKSYFLFGGEKRSWMKKSVTAYIRMID
jgi:hypothetical protein